MLVGVPASGKSTWATENYHLYDKILSTDDIITSISGTYGFTYDQAFKDLIGFAEKAFFEQLEEACVRKLNFIIDRTNLTAKGRKRLLDRIKPYGYQVNAVVFPIPEQAEWERRLNSRKGKTIPNDVLESMKRNFQSIEDKEGFTEVILYEG